jgi:putative transposase
MWYNQLMRKTFRYRLFPTHAQKRQLEQQLELCRWVYNETLATRKQAWEERAETLNLYATNKLLTAWKVTRPELSQVHSQVLQNAQERVDLAFKAFFRRVKADGEKVGYPRFRGQGWYDSMTFKQSGFELSGKLRLSKIGDVRLELHRPLEGVVKTLTVARARTGKWYACFSCEVEAAPLPKTGRVVGIDVGLKTFAMFSNGEIVANPRFFRRDEKALAKAQRNGKKQAAVRIYERIGNRRGNFAHQLSRQIVNTYDLIALEKLEIQDMQDGNFRGMNKSIADAAWRQLRQNILFKAESAGKECVEVDPRGTTQRCSRCGAVVPKALSVRKHDCPHCGLKIDRDLNAALNILALGLQSGGRSRATEAPAFRPWE